MKLIPKAKGLNYGEIRCCRDSRTAQRVLDRQDPWRSDCGARCISILTYACHYCTTASSNNASASYHLLRCHVTVFISEVAGSYQPYSGSPNTKPGLCSSVIEDDPTCTLQPASVEDRCRLRPEPLRTPAAFMSLTSKDSNVFRKSEEKKHRCSLFTVTVNVEVRSGLMTGASVETGAEERHDHPVCPLNAL